MTLLRKRKNHERLSNFSQNVLNIAGKNLENPVNTDGKPWSWSEKTVQTRFLVSESNFISLKGLFVLTT